MGRSGAAFTAGRCKANLPVRSCPAPTLDGFQPSPTSPLGKRCTKLPFAKNENLWIDGFRARRNQPHVLMRLKDAEKKNSGAEKYKKTNRKIYTFLDVL